MNKIAKYLYEKRYNKKVAVRYKEKKETYSSLHKKAEDLAKLLNEIDSETIGIYLPNSISYMVAYFGCMYSGKIVFPEMMMCDLKSVKSDLEACRIRAIIISQKLKTDFNKFFKNIEFLDYEDVISIAIIYDILPIDVKIDDTVCTILKTSGTTNYKSKYVMLTDVNLDVVVKMFCEQYEVSPHIHKFDNVLFVLPLPSSYCNAQMLIHFYLGDTIILYDGPFSVAKFWSMIERYKVPRIETISTMLIMLLKDEFYKKYNIKSLKCIGTGGMELPIKYFDLFVKKFPGIIILQEYGMTEASPLISLMDETNWLRKKGSVGRPHKLLQVMIDNNDEILVKGNNIMAGYYLDKEETDKVLIDGWLHTGDLGRIDEDGYLYLTGRKKNIIVSGGYNISPEEIERVIIELPQVEAVLVTGIEHQILGQSILAQVVTTSLCTAKEIRNYCKLKLAIYKVPYKIEFVEKIPSTIGGKMKRSL